MADVETKFQAALDVIHSLPKDGPYKPAPDMLLKFYGYYKQATIGPCNAPKPWAFDVINKAKWEAWNKLGHMAKEVAMDNYVTELKKVMDSTPRLNDKEIIEVLPASDASTKFVQTLGNFYEVVDSRKAEIENLKNLVTNGVNHHDDKDDHDSADDVNGDALPMNGDALPVNGDALPVNGDALPVINGSNHTFDEQNIGKVQAPPHSSSFTPDEQKSYDTVESVDDIDVETTGYELKSESDDEFCDSSADVAILAKNYSSSQSDSSSMTNDSLAASPTKDEDSPYRKKSAVEKLLEFQQNEPLTYGGEKGTHGAGYILQQSHRTVVIDQEGSQRIQRTLPPQPNPVLGASGSGNGQPQRNRNTKHDEIQERIAFILLQLQRDMHSVLNRLTTLETITMAKQHEPTHCHHCHPHDDLPRAKQNTPFWWPFPDVTPKTTLFFMLWPFVVKILWNFFQRKYARRR